MDGQHESARFTELMECHLTTSLLESMAHRVTPRGECGEWMLTSSIDAVTYWEGSDSDRRGWVCEQLAHYGIDVAAINAMRS
jgi:hypothetical protein